MTHKLIKTDNYLLVVDDSGIIEDCYAIHYHPTGELELVSHEHKYGCKLCKKIISHLPLNGSPILQGVDLLPPYTRHQEDGLEDYAQSCNQLYKEWLVTGYKSGYNKAREKWKYTEEDMREAISHAYKQARPDTEYEPFPLFYQYPTEFECEMEYYYHSSPKFYHDADFVKCDEGQYDSIRRTIPECETKIFPKTITTTQGIQWVGKYK